MPAKYKQRLRRRYKATPRSTGRAAQQAGVRAHVGERAPQVAAARGAVMQAVRALPQLVARLLGAARRARAAPPRLARAARPRLRGRQVGREGRIAAVVHAPPGLARPRLRRRQVGREGRVPAVIQVPAFLRAAVAARACGRRAAGAPAPARGRAALAVEHAQARPRRLRAAQPALQLEQGGPARGVAWRQPLHAGKLASGRHPAAGSQAARPSNAHTAQRELCSATLPAHRRARHRLRTPSNLLRWGAAGRAAHAASRRLRDCGRRHRRSRTRPGTPARLRRRAHRPQPGRTGAHGSGPALRADNRPEPLSSTRCLQRSAPQQAVPTGAPGSQLGVLHPNFTGASAAQPGTPAAAGRAVRPRSRAARSTGPKLGRPKRPCAQHGRIPRPAAATLARRALPVCTAPQGHLRARSPTPGGRAAERGPNTPGPRLPQPAFPAFPCPGAVGQLHRTSRAARAAPTPADA